jgi:hypothetical protein
MGNLRLYGSTSGYIEIAPPAVGTNNILTLPTDSIQPGMVLINNTDFISATAVNINNCFTSTYSNYRIMLKFKHNSTGDVAWMRFRTSGSDNTSSTYQSMGGYGNASGYVYDSTGSGTSLDKARVGYVPSSTCLMSLDISSPALSEISFYSATYVGGDNNNRFWSGAFNSTTIFDGFSLYTTSPGTVSGTVRIYGYRNS